MRRKATMGRLALFCLVPLTACADKPPEIVTKVEYVRQEIPDALLTCPEGPPVPDPGTATQRSVAAFLVQAVHAGEDCRAKLEAIRRLVQTSD